MGASGTDNFCLRWNDFAENVSGAFKELRSESDFFDVTLACTDSGSRTLQAHKVILSACSNFFKSTFRQQTNANKHPNPYIYLRGVTYNDLNSILDFIYNGEVNVAQEELNSFLAVAEELQIKGLTNRDSNSSSTNNASSESPLGQSSSTSGAAGTPRKSSSGGSGAAHPGVARPRSAQSQEHPPVKKIRRSSPAPSASSTPTQEVSRSKAIAQAPIPIPIEVEPEEVKEVVNIKDDPEVLGLASTSAVNPDIEAGQEFGGEDYDESYDGYYEDDGAEMGDGAEGTDGTKGQFEITETPIELGLARMENGMVKCLVCTRSFQHNSTAKRHYKEKHLQLPACYDCPYCGRKYTLLRYLKEHMSNIHQITQKMLNSRFLPNQD